MPLATTTACMKHANELRPRCALMEMPCYCENMHTSPSVSHECRVIYDLAKQGHCVVRVGLVGPEAGVHDRRHPAHEQAKEELLGRALYADEENNIMHAAMALTQTALVP